MFPGMALICMSFLELYNGGKTSPIVATTKIKPKNNNKQYKQSVVHYKPCYLRLFVISPIRYKSWLPSLLRAHSSKI